ncbi:hypothetical protein NIES2100_34360 [Calothrix sp. NIES-2100]|nr:hypothetical protein NIES2100_34360 [Calothrix sp. NIES-2100]
MIYIVITFIKLLLDFVNLGFLTITFQRHLDVSEIVPETDQISFDSGVTSIADPDKF